MLLVSSWLLNVCCIGQCDTLQLLKSLYSLSSTHYQPVLAAAQSKLGVQVSHSHYVSVSRSATADCWCNAGVLLV
jgi:hypothetical protein